MSATAPPAARAAEAAPPAAAEAAPATSIAAAAARLHAAAASLPAPGAAFLDASVSPEFRRDVQEVRERSVKLLSRLKKVKKWRGKEERERERHAAAVLPSPFSTSSPRPLFQTRKTRRPPPPPASPSWVTTRERPGTPSPMFSTLSWRGSTGKRRRVPLRPTRLGRPRPRRR